MKIERLLAALIFSLGLILSVGFLMPISRASPLDPIRFAVTNASGRPNPGAVAFTHDGTYALVAQGGEDQVLDACQTWNLASDFRVSPDQENPNRDSCGNPDVWHFMQSADLNRDPQTYSLLPNFTNSRAGIEGLEAWYGDAWADPPEGLPAIAINRTGETVDLGYLWPPNVVNAHPTSQQLAIAGWQSPLTGIVMITGFVRDLDNSDGDGILWTIDKGDTNLASGSIVEGGSQDFGNGTGGESLAGVAVNQGDFIYFAIHPNADLYYDSTELDVSITLLQGIHLVPPSQSGSGEPGATVSYMVTLANYTGATDSFNLTLGDHGWETTLSTGSLGPLADGESATFTVLVTVPADAEYFSTDTVVVTASSVADPSVYADTSLTTQAYAPPKISVTPDALTSSQYVNDVTTQDLTITNEGPAPLDFTVGGGLVLWNRLGSDDEVLHSEFGANGTIVGTEYAYEPARHGSGYVRKAFGQNYLQFPASVLDDLHEKGSIELWINPKVPQPIPYEYGVFGLVGAPFGHGGVPEDYNVWLMWGDTVTQQGLFGGVKFDSNAVQTPAEPAQFVAEPFVPFHAAICWDIAGVDGTDDKVRVYRDGQPVGRTADSWNPDGTERYDIILGYGPDGEGYDKFIVDNIKIWNYAKTDFSDRFVEASTAGTSWLSLDPGSGTVPAYSSALVQVTFDATTVQPGNYTTQIVVQSNDPLTPMATVPVAMTVLPTESMGWVEGTVSQAWTGNPVAATLSAAELPYTVATDPSTGHYKLWLEAGSYTLHVTSPGYLPQTAEVSITAQQGVTQDFGLSVDAPPPVAGFWFAPYDPSTFDTVQFYDSSYDTSWVGIESWVWDLGDGTTAVGPNPAHHYAADGDYAVQITVTTYDGRSASTVQVVPVRTHDVAITRFRAPEAAKAGQTRSITVGINNRRYPERVEVQLYKSTPEGDQWLGSTIQSVPVRPARRTTDFRFSYTFTADDATAGTVTFRAVAILIDARDAQPADNEATAVTRQVTR